MDVVNANRENDVCQDRAVGELCLKCFRLYGIFVSDAIFCYAVDGFQFFDAVRVSEHNCLHPYRIEVSVRQ